MTVPPILRLRPMLGTLPRDFMFRSFLTSSESLTVLRKNVISAIIARPTKAPARPPMKNCLLYEVSFTGFSGIVGSEIRVTVELPITKSATLG